MVNLVKWSGNYLALAHVLKFDCFVGDGPKSFARDIDNDIPRTPFIASEAEFLTLKGHFKNPALEKRYTQGDFVGGPFLACGYAQFLKRQVDRYQDCPEKIHCTESITVAYLNDKGIPCGFDIHYFEHDPCEWAITILEDSANLEHSQRLTTVFTPPKSLMRTMIGNKGWSSCANTEWFLHLKSKRLERMFRHLIHSDGTLNLPITHLGSAILTGQFLSEKMLAFFESEETDACCYKLEKLICAGYFKRSKISSSDSVLKMAEMSDAMVDDYVRFAKMVCDIFGEESDFARTFFSAMATYLMSSQGETERKTLSLCFKKICQKLCSDPEKDLIAAIQDNQVLKTTLKSIQNNKNCSQARQEFFLALDEAVVENQNPQEIFKKLSDIEGSLKYQASIFEFVIANQLIQLWEMEGCRKDFNKALQLLESLDHIFQTEIQPKNDTQRQLINTYKMQVFKAVCTYFKSAKGDNDRVALRNTVKSANHTICQNYLDTVQYTGRLFICLMIVTNVISHMTVVGIAANLYHKHRTGNYLLFKHCRSAKRLRSLPTTIINTPVVVGS